MARGKGWRGEPGRHSLAAKGVKTTSKTDNKSESWMLRQRLSRSDSGFTRFWKRHDSELDAVSHSEYETTASKLTSKVVNIDAKGITRFVDKMFRETMSLFYWNNLSKEGLARVIEDLNEILYYSTRGDFAAAEDHADELERDIKSGTYYVDVEGDKK